MVSVSFRTYRRPRRTFLAVTVLALLCYATSEAARTSSAVRPPLALLSARNPVSVGARSALRRMKCHPMLVGSASAAAGGNVAGGSYPTSSFAPPPTSCRIANRRARKEMYIFRAESCLRRPTPGVKLSVLTSSGPVGISGDYDPKGNACSSSTTTTLRGDGAAIGDGDRGSGTSVHEIPSGGGETSAAAATSMSAGGGVADAAAAGRQLVFWENMVCGAISRSVAQVLMHPANTMKTMLQANRSEGGGAAAMSVATLARPSNLRTLTRGAGAQFVLSVPHGAVNFAVLEYVRRQIGRLVERSYGGNAEARRNERARKRDAAADFLSSAISTVCCSVVSTPQMMITDNIMAGRYPNLPQAVTGVLKESGPAGFYTGWWPGLAGKIPSYALTWTFFQQLKRAQLRIMKRPPKDIENSIMGCVASATTVCLMIPMDTIKTRLVTQGQYANLVPYNGIVDCAMRIAREEGVSAFYRGLVPRLVSVVPMIGIQFGVYEYMKKMMLQQDGGGGIMKGIMGSSTQSKVFDEVAMEVAADDEQPFPAPYFQEEDDESDLGRRKQNRNRNDKKDQRPKKKAKSGS